jgi:hypothetical protein
MMLQVTERQQQGQQPQHQQQQRPLVRLPVQRVHASSFADLFNPSLDGGVDIIGGAGHVHICAYWGGHGWGVAALFQGCTLMIHALARGIKGEASECACFEGG